jgi:hypothetical protein
MAADEHTGTQAPGEDLSVAIASLLFECRLTLEAVLMGLRTLVLRHPFLKTEIDVVLRFAQQGAEAFEALALKLVEVLPLRGLQA